MRRTNRVLGVGWMAEIVSLFGEGGRDVWWLSLAGHLHGKKVPFICVQEQSGPHFLLGSAEFRLRTSGKEWNNSLQPSLSSFGNTPSLCRAEVARDEISVTLCICAEHWWVTDGWSHLGQQWAARHRADDRGLRASHFACIRRANFQCELQNINISHHITDLNIDNDFKEKK